MPDHYRDTGGFAGRRPPSSAAYLKLCVALPALHSSALHLLSIMLAVGGATLYPMLGATGRLLGGLMRRTVAAGQATFRETPTQVPHCLCPCTCSAEMPSWQSQSLPALAMPPLLLRACG